METERSLLTLGNGKVGQAIAIWSLPPVSSCPGRSKTCETHCYARHGHFTFPVVINRLEWNYQQAMRDDFTQRMITEIRSNGYMVVRIHGAGDYFSVPYAQAWVAIIKACKTTVFYSYTRSHRIDEFADVLAKLAALKNSRLWYSLDRDIPRPRVIPPRVRTCYLQVRDDEAIPKVGLVFRKRGLRSLPVLGNPVCPAETLEKKGTKCGACQKCFRTD